VTVEINEEDYLQHYGILRKSGRWPWGSGGNEVSRANAFYGIYAELKAKGLTDSEIARSFASQESIDRGHPDFTSTELRATKSMAKNARKAADISTAQRYRDDGLSNVAIGKKMGINVSSVRALLEPGARDRADKLTATANMLREEVAKKGMIDIGRGAEFYVSGGVAQNHLQTAAAVLKGEGYKVINVQVPTGQGNKTNVKVLAPPGTEYRDIVKDLGQIKSISSYTDDGGRGWSEIKPPLSVSSKRVAVRYKEDGGEDADGVIYVRPGKSDLDMGAANYAQVRISIDGTHYLKGMAMYKDDLPAGVDLMFNTNKSDTGNKLDAMKKLKRLQAPGDNPKTPDKWTGPIDMENPFGSIVRQLGDRDEAGRVVKVTSAMNLVNEEGDWNRWSKNLSAQMLSKQKPTFVKERLDETFANRKAGLDEIMALNNPAVKKKLLEAYAEDLDSAAVHLKAAGLPRQRTQVILPLNSLKPNEVYAPNFNNGENVVLIRYPHGGIFEIPELKVNNRHPEARKLLGTKVKDAIAIHSDVAKRLSGADFDGDTVVVIPNGHKKISTKGALAGLKDFDPQRTYPAYEGMPKLTPDRKQKLMGDVSNLITDMTIKGANDYEIAQAVRHSMVVIDAEKHNLNYRQSAIDNNISSLKKKYQGKNGLPGRANSGASTIISQAKSPIRVPKRRLQKASEGGSVDPKTGKLIYRTEGGEYVNKNGKVVQKTTAVKKLAYFDDARVLSSGTPVENMYADYSNRMKAMANQTRKAALSTPNIKYSESAGKAYAPQVSTLKAKLNTALKNAPLERQARVIANATLQERKAANPDMDKAEIKKLEHLVLAQARNKMGAKKEPIHIDDDEWEAIQSGAVRPTTLSSILDHANMDRVRELATPKPKLLMTTANTARAERMLNGGATQAEVASALGVSLTTLKRALGEK
jgi:hypothetical protein